MAAATDLSEIAASIPLDDIPHKLRCGSCNKICLGAIRLPCCDQQICEACHLSKPKSCPVCDHEPLSAEDCKPHKTSRLTVRAYLKAEEKKREKVKQDAAAAAATAEEGSNPTATTDPEVTTTPAVEVTAATQDGAAEATLNHDETTPLNGNLTSDALESLDIANGHSAEANAEDGSDTASSAGSSVEFILQDPRAEREPIFGRSTRADQTSNRPVSQQGSDTLRRNSTTEQPHANGHYEDGKTPQQHHSEQNGPNNQTPGGFGAANNFNNFNNFAGFNPMMAMQGGGNPAMFQNMQQMMAQGMPAMMQNMQNAGMDPMSMMQMMMMGGYDGQNMQGMNMMNMGYQGGWNMGMNGDYGPNAGYHNGGYNQQSHHGHFNQMQRAQFNSNYNQNRFSRGGRGRGRGFDRNQQFGGRFGNQPNQAFGNNNQQYDYEQNHVGQTEAGPETVSRATNLDVMEKPISDADAAPDLPNGDSKLASDQETNKITDAPRSTSAMPQLDAERKTPEAVASAVVIPETNGVVPQVDVDERASSVTDNAVASGSNNQFDLGQRARAASSTHARGSLHGRGSARSTGQLHDAIELTPTPAFIDQPKGLGVAGAPTGPKAYREGMPNVGFRGGRGGAAVAGRGGMNPPTPVTAHQPGLPTSSRSQTPTSTSHSRRNRSRSSSPRTREGDRQRRRDTERKDRQSRHHSREREEAVEGSTSGHKSRTDHEKHRGSRRERDREHGRERGGDRSRERHHRRRSRSPAKDDRPVDEDSAHSSRRESKYREREDAKREEKNKRRSRHEADESADRHRHRPSRPDRRASELETQETMRAPPTSAPAPFEFKIKDSSKRKNMDAPATPRPAPPPPTPTPQRSASSASKRADLDAQKLNAQKQIVASENPNLDHYAIMREASARERIAAEEQRRISTGMNSANMNAPSGPSANRKRNSEVMETGGLPNGNEEQKQQKRRRHDMRDRRTSYQDHTESPSARALRVEHERESARWSRG